VFFGWLQERGYVPANPVARVHPVREPHKVIVALSTSQVRALLEQPQRDSFLGARDHCFLLLLLDTGLRLSEALAVRVEQLDWSEGRLLVLGKGSKERRVGLSSCLLGHLRGYLKLRASTLAAVATAEQGWLFATAQGGPLDPKAVQKRLRRYGAQAGLTGVRVSPHTLRHTYALHFVRNGGDPFTLQRILGHGSLDITRRYCELAEADVLQRQRALTPLLLLAPETPAPARPPAGAGPEAGAPGW
jgi:integrase/recombinase XerD